MSLSVAALFFLVGYIFGVIIALSYTRLYDRSWASGLVIVGLSTPVTIIYFFGLWALSHWRPFSLSSTGMAFAGLLSALFPVLCGPFPLYALRLGLAVPFITAQVVLLILISAIFARLP